MSRDLTPEFASYVKKQVKSGLYSSQTQVVEAGLRALMTQEQVYTRWLNNELAAAEQELARGEGIPYDFQSIMDKAKAATKNPKPRSGRSTR